MNRRGEDEDESFDDFINNLSCDECKEMLAYSIEQAVWGDLGNLIGAVLCMLLLFVGLKVL